MNVRVPQLLLIFIPLALFSGTVNGTFLSLDESEVLQALDRFSRDPLDYFLPSGGATHPYYRPILGLSLLLDNRMWGTQASGFHLTNLLLHVANALLVYVLALRVTSGPRRELIAFLAALLFAVHPIHTEAVNWVSGRTDMLATLFSLLSFLAYLRYRNDSDWRYLMVSVAWYLLGAFSKEVAVAMPLIILAHHFFLTHVASKAERVKRALGLLVVYGGATACYLFLRSLALARGDVGLAKSVNALDVSWLDHARVLVYAVGFYVKKLVVPFPLSFSVDQIDSPGYLVLGLFAAAVACVALANRGEKSFWVWWILFSLAPSLVIAIADIAWTPVAERYLYLPSVGYCILLVMALFAAVARIRRPEAAVAAVMLVVSAGFFVGTYLRNAIWQEPIRLWEDTVRKSPRFPMARNEYGLALVAEQRYDEAKIQFEKGIELGDRQNPLQNLAAIAQHVEHDYEKTERLLSLALQSGDPRPRLYTRLAVTNLHMAGQAADPSDRLRKAIKLYQQAYEHHGSPVSLYRIGQIHLRLGEYEQARSSFEQAIEKGGSDDFFVAPSKTILAKLSRQSG